MIELICTIMPAKLRKIFFKIIYFILGIYYNIKFENKKFPDFIIGTTLVSLTMLLTDFIVRKIAYYLTGLIYTEKNHNLEEKKASHWAFRVIALTIIIIINYFTHLPERLISLCVPEIAMWIRTIWGNWCTDFTNQIIEVFSK